MSMSFFYSFDFVKFRFVFKTLTMKLAFKTIFILGVSCSLLFYSGCSSKHPAPPVITDLQIDLLTKSVWKATAVTKDGKDVLSPDYSSFTMTLTGTKGQTAPFVNFTTGGRTGTKYPWATTGKLTFDATNPATTLGRDDGVTVTYAATATQFTMSFTYNGPGFNARTGVVTGLWQFTFSH